MSTITKKKTFQVTCTNCGGDGSYETTHPQWGSRTCPEAYVQVTCDECDGDGTKTWDRDDLVRDLFEILNAKHEEPYEDVAEAIIARFDELDILPGAR